MFPNDFSIKMIIWKQKAAIEQHNNVVLVI